MYNTQLTLFLTDLVTWRSYKGWFRPYLVGIGLKFIYSEKATKFCEISTLLLSYVVPVKSKIEISQNFVAFSKCMNFIKISVHHQEIAIGNFENVDYHFSENNTWNKKKFVKWANVFMPSGQLISSLEVNKLLAWNRLSQQCSGQPEDI